MPTLLVPLALLAMQPPATPAITIDHVSVACIVAGKFPTIEARIDPVGQLVRARVYFHADDHRRWYFVEMTAVPGAYRGVLPPPLKKTRRIHYYVETTDTNVAQSRTQEFSPEVVPDPNSCPSPGLVAVIAAATPVVVGAPAGASAVPAGFASNGVAGAAVGGGLGTTALVVGGVAVAGGATAAVAASGGGGQEDGGSNPSPSAPIVVEGTVYSDTCCPAGLVDPASTARNNSRRISGAVVSSSLDSVTTTTDGQGVFRLNTQTPCRDAVFTLNITAAGCDPLTTSRNWGCVSNGPNSYALNLLCR